MRLKYPFQILGLTILLSCLSAFASEVTPTAVLQKVLETNTPVAQDEITGEWATMIKKLTHSTSNPIVKAENLGKQGVCTRVRMTTTLANIPTTTGGSAGDYKTVSMLNFCPGDKLPPGVKKIELLSCTIGNKPCTGGPAQ